MLTEKMRRALEAYHLSGNKVEAYRRGYNAARMAPATLRKRAHELFARPEMQAELKRLQAEARARHNLEIDQRVRVCKEIALSNITDIVRFEDGHIYLRDADSLTDGQRSAIKSLSCTKDGFSVEMHDKVHALIMLAQYLGM